MRFTSVFFVLTIGLAIAAPIANKQGPDVAIRSVPARQSNHMTSVYRRTDDDELTADYKKRDQDDDLTADYRKRDDNDELTADYKRGTDDDHTADYR